MTINKIEYIISDFVLAEFLHELNAMYKLIVDYLIDEVLAKRE
jgi:hypothetical protein